MIASPTGTVSFPHLAKPEAMNEGQPKKYSVVLIFDADEPLTEMRKMAEACAAEKWPEVQRNLRSPFRKNEEKDGIEGYPPGGIFVTFSTREEKGRPKIAAADKSLIEDLSEVYPGCRGRVACSCYAYDKGGNRGIAFGLSGLQKMGEGKRLGGDGGNPLSVFGIEEGEAEGTVEMFG